MPSLDLMERAGAGRGAGGRADRPDGPVAVVCGKGNNGGDGLVVARLLREAGREVTRRCAPPRRRSFAGDALENLERLPGEAPVRLGRMGRGATGGRRRARAEVERWRAAVVVDALLGTGFRGEPAAPSARRSTPSTHARRRS